MFGNRFLASMPKAAQVVTAFGLAVASFLVAGPKSAQALGDCGVENCNHGECYLATSGTWANTYCVFSSCWIRGGGYECHYSCGYSGCPTG